MVICIEKTMERDQKIRELGYTLITKWESEFKMEMKSSTTDYVRNQCIYLFIFSSPTCE